MSQENVELVRTFFKDWNAGDMEGVRELYDPDAVMEVTPDWPERGPQSDMEWTNVITIRDSRIVNVEFVWDHAEALEAAGLSEQDAQTDSS